MYINLFRRRTAIRTGGRGIAAACAAIIVGTFAGAGISHADAGMERFYQQRLDWRACDDEALDRAGARCADVTVPLNYGEPQGRTITVAISRVPAADPAHRRGVLLSNPGGPGGSGLDLTVWLGDKVLAPDVRDSYDLIGMDPRGIGRSTPVSCGWPIGSPLQSAGPDLLSFGESVATAADLAARCIATQGDQVSYITTRNTARDMDVIRAALGEERINYFGLSYGTYLGSVFTQMFPERVERVVLDSAVDPERYHVAMIQDMGAPNEAAFDAWAAWAADRDDQYHFGTTGSAVRATITDLIGRSARRPIRIGGDAVSVHVLPMLVFDGIVDARKYPVLADELRQITDAANGLPVQPGKELKRALDDYLHPAPDAPESGPAQAMILCGDAPAPRDPSWYWRNIEASRATEPMFGAFANNLTPCAFWLPPVEAPTAVHNSVPALILQATGDPRTAYRDGVGLHRAMTGSRLITMPDVVTHGVSPKSSCARRIVDDYFRDGTLPGDDVTCPAG